jgi:hypothetical protein
LSGGNTVFAGGHFVLGLAFGSAAASIAAGLVVPIVVLIALVGIGFVGWRFINRRRQGSTGGIADWTDACCPACLLLGAGVTR